MIHNYILQAVTSEGKSVYIDEVRNGKKCNCFCLECGSPLIAKQGKIKTHHFAHANGNDNIKCSQTALHLLAKEIIYEEKRIPILINGKVQIVSVTEIEKEKNLGDIIPDLYTEFEGKPISIEIFVSHPVDSIKYDKIQRHKLTTFEINLSKQVFESKEEVKEAIYNLENVQLIYDFDFFQFFIDRKKSILIQNGIYKTSVNGITQKCPMSIKMLGSRIIKMDNIKSDFCEDCFFGYKDILHPGFYCVGHCHGKLESWFLRANTSKNKFMSSEETMDKLNSYKKRIAKAIV
ncbi:competence protein CoiA family protein [Treponema sp.]|uniref:competence protein CoiA family protein n=1 Tax=Treponema sp. TaxID=166 RepID=UPI00388E4422